MRIRDLGVIDDAVVELAPGFTAVTGETGAGKTMVVTSLGLLLGGRADPGLVRNGAGRAVVEGRLELPEGSPAAARALEAGAELDDGALLISRTVSAEGRSRAFVGGRAVPVGLLAEIGEDLIAVHGQTD
ncbi:AAA family ATPase, partial [Kitasatospora sp. NPDC001574]